MIALIAGLFTSLLVVGTIGSFATNMTAEETHAESSFVASEWAGVYNFVSPTPYTVNENSIVGSNNSTIRGNFLVKSSDVAIGDYEVSIVASGTMGYPNTKSVHIGIVPWYLDDNNFLLAYMDWDPSEQTNGMRELQLTGRIEGKAPYIYRDPSFVQSEWNDVWMIGDNEQYAVPENSTINFKVTKTLTEAGDADLFSLYLNSNLLGYFIIRDTVKYANKAASVGVYAYDDTVTFSDFTVNSLNNTATYAKIGTDGSGKSANEAWNVTDNVYSVNSLGGTDWKNTMLVKNNSYKTSGYEIFYDISSLNHDTTYGIGGIISYKDGYNYLAGIVDVTSTGVMVGFAGKYTTSELEEIQYVNVNEFTLLDGFDSTSITNIGVAKHGYNYELYINGNIVYEYQNSELIAGQDVGICLYGVEVNLSNVTITQLAYVSYDWYMQTLNGRESYISANTQNSITSPGGYYNFKAASITSGDTNKLTSIYFPTTYYENVSISLTTATEITSETVFGVYPWIENPSRYFRVMVTASKIIAEYQFDESTDSEEFDLPTSYTFVCPDTETRTLSVSINQGVATIKLGMNSDELTTITDSFTILGRNLSNVANVGIIAAGTAVGFENVSLDGYAAYDEVIENDWHTYGSRASSWLLIDDNTFSCSQSYGTTYMQDRALTANFNVQNFYSGATFTASNLSGSEQKAALVPYFKDFNNYLIVMFSKWTVNSSGSIVITGRLNGEVLGGTEWHEYTSVSYIFEDTANKLETQIDEDTVYVYLNGSTNPTLSCTLEGLSTRDLTQQYSGFFFFNCDLLIDNFNISSQERVYSFDEKPVIAYYGSLTTTAYVNDSISLPIFTASNSIGDILTPVINVTDPNGDAVTVTNNKFTPSIVGTYHVEVNCEDSWGNTADPLDYDIVVSERIVDDGGNDLPYQAIIVISIFGSLGAIAIGLGIFFTIRSVRKKKMIK